MTSLSIVCDNIIDGHSNIPHTSPVSSISTKVSLLGIINLLIKKYHFIIHNSPHMTYIWDIQSGTYFLVHNSTSLPWMVQPEQVCCFFIITLRKDITFKYVLNIIRNVILQCCIWILHSWIVLVENDICEVLPGN